MRCDKEKTLLYGLLFTVILTVGGMLVQNSYHQVEATQEIKKTYDDRYNLLQLNIKEDISELKQDVKEIKSYLIQNKP